MFQNFNRVCFKNDRSANLHIIVHSLEEIYDTFSYFAPLKKKKFD